MGSSAAQARSLVMRGFTLIELLITLSIFAFLTMLAAPLYSEMIANSEIRNAAENILVGIRTAQGEAVRSNQPVEFVLTGGTTPHWDIYTTNGEDLAFDTTAWKSYSFAEGATRATVSATGTVTFNGFGQVIPNTDASDTLSQVNVSSSASTTNKRNLRVIVGTKDKATAMKLCDPNYAADDPMGCPS